MKKIEVNEEVKPTSAPSRNEPASGEAVAGLVAREWAFVIEDRGFQVRASYQDELGNNVEITRGGRPFKTFTYPGYRIWNIAAHFHDYVSEWLAEQDRFWREVDSFATTT